MNGAQVGNKHIKKQDVRKAGWDQTGKGFSLVQKSTCPKVIQGGLSLGCSDTGNINLLEAD